MIIRNAEKKDLLKCEELSNIPELQWASWWYYDVEFLERYFTDTCIFLVTEENEEVIWYILGEQVVGKWSIVWSISVDENHRWKWIGQKMVEEFQNILHQRGGEWMNLIWKADEPRLKHFYKKCGFDCGNNYIEYDKFF